MSNLTTLDNLKAIEAFNKNNEFIPDIKLNFSTNIANEKTWHLVNKLNIIQNKIQKQNLQDFFQLTYSFEYEDDNILSETVHFTIEWHMKELVGKAKDNITRTVIAQINKTNNGVIINMLQNDIKYKNLLDMNRQQNINFSDITCPLCNKKNSRRKQTYAVLNHQTNQLEFVGSDCVQDIIPVKIIKTINSLINDLFNVISDTTKKERSLDNKIFSVDELVQQIWEQTINIKTTRKTAFINVVTNEHSFNNLLKDFLSQYEKYNHYKNLNDETYQMISNQFVNYDPTHNPFNNTTIKYKNLDELKEFWENHNWGITITTNSLIEVLSKKYQNLFKFLYYEDNILPKLDLNDFKQYLKKSRQIASSNNNSRILLKNISGNTSYLKLLKQNLITSIYQYINFNIVKFLSDQINKDINKNQKLSISFEKENKQAFEDFVNSQNKQNENLNNIKSNIIQKLHNFSKQLNNQTNNDLIQLYDNLIKYNILSYKEYPNNLVYFTLKVNIYKKPLFYKFIKLSNTTFNNISIIDKQNIIKKLIHQIYPSLTLLSNITEKDIELNDAQEKFALITPLNRKININNITISNLLQILISIHFDIYSSNYQLLIHSQN